MDLLIIIASGKIGQFCRISDERRVVPIRNPIVGGTHVRLSAWAAILTDGENGRQI